MTKFYRSIETSPGSPVIIAVLEQDDSGTAIVAAEMLEVMGNSF